jgi:hypothetical protein
MVIWGISFEIQIFRWSKLAKNLAKGERQMVFGAVLAAGLPGQARAADVVRVQCDAYFGYVNASQASAGVTLPTSCAPSTSSNCSQCVAMCRPVALS